MLTAASGDAALDCQGKATIWGQLIVHRLSPSREPFSATGLLGHWANSGAASSLYTSMYTS
ncbi:hypothetical protein K449DRAFT_430203 [Hypoxylon sp. EC38]|nr:hypothetical protein K449DRAFT_430203 [Hypoxylon sp. EC38]